MAARTRPNYISVHVDQNRSLVHSAWLRAVDSHEYRVAFDHFFKLICVNKVCYWLADITQLCTPNMYDQRWTAEFMGSILENTDLKKIAVVLRNDLFMEVVLEKISEEIRRTSHKYVQIALFNDFDQADSWLKTNHDMEALFREDLMNN